MTDGWIDTHCHLHFAAFDADRDLVVDKARALGMQTALVCAASVSDAAAAVQCARRYKLHYAVGIHPLFISDQENSAEELYRIEQLADSLEGDPLFAAIGEIGMDSAAGNASEKVQREVFVRQLKLAVRLAKPVSVHARGCIDTVCSLLKKHTPPGGIIHAFNGSMEQARRLRNMGFLLGFGGAASYDGSKKIRRILTEIDDEGFVLETDAPDMLPQFRRMAGETRTLPCDIEKYVAIAAELRSCTSEKIACISTRNAKKLLGLGICE